MEDILTIAQNERKIFITEIIRSKKLLGLEKEDVGKLMGQESNYFAFDRWTYLISQNWFYKKYLVLYFKEGKVHLVRVERNK